MDWKNQKEIAQLRAVIQEVITTDRLERMKMREEAVAKRESEKVTKTYLISFSGHLIALPDEQGRAVMAQAVYARVTMNADEIPFGNFTGQVIAHGDGRRLSNPVHTIFSSHVASLTEIDESILAEARAQHA